MIITNEASTISKTLHYFNKEDKKRAERILKQIADDNEILLDKDLETEDCKILF